MMRRPARCVGLALAAIAWPLGQAARAQTGPQTNLVLTVAAGVVNGSDLWAIPRQPFCPIFSSGSCTSGYDTLRLARDMGSSLALRFAFSYFPGRTLGVQGEVAYLGLPLDDACAVLDPNPARQTAQICGSIAGLSQSTGAISFSASAVVRGSPRHFLSPYAAAGVGLVAFDHSTIEMAGSDSIGRSYLVVADNSPKRVAPSLLLSAGFTTRVGSGYQFRFEVRDVLAAFDRVTGPTDVTLVPPTETRWFHHFALTLGLDVVLEQKRGRRY
jgi:opacity protein-like surface antigen